MTAHDLGRHLRCYGIDSVSSPHLDALQELAREANTVGSKSASAAMAREVVDLKGEVERLREQVQNVE